MKRILNVLSPKRLPLYALLLATLMTVVICLPSCKDEKSPEQPVLLINDENNPPVTLTFHRKADGRYVTGNAEVDDLSVPMQMNSQTAENIYEWLTHFTIGEKIEESEDYSPFYFTVKYKNGEEAHFGFYDCEIDGEKYAIKFTEGAVGAQGEADWQEIMANTLRPYALDDNFIYFLNFPTDLRVYTEENIGYNKWEHQFPSLPVPLLLPLSGSGYNSNMPTEAHDALGLYRAYPRASIIPNDENTVKGGGLFYATEPNIIGNANQHYQVVTFPTLINENGEIKVSRTKGVCDLICDELIKWVEESGKGPDGHWSNNDFTLESDYDWTGHVFPQPKDNDIIKIEIARDAYGAMATGIDAIDHIRVDIKDTYDRAAATPEDKLKNAKTRLKSLVYDKEVIPSAVESVNYQYRIIATYADGTVVDCPLPYAEKDGKKYTIKRRRWVTTGDDYASVSIENKIMIKQWEILRELGYSSDIPDEIAEIGCGIGDTSTLYSADGAVALTLPPNDVSYPSNNVADNFFLIEIPKPENIRCDEYVVEETADKSRRVTYYAGSGGLLSYEKDGVTTWYRAPLLSDNSGDIFSFTYPDNVVAIFHLNLENDIIIRSDEQ